MKARIMVFLPLVEALLWQLNTFKSSALVHNDTDATYMYVSSIHVHVPPTLLCPVCNNALRQPVELMCDNIVCGECCCKQV